MMYPSCPPWAGWYGPWALPPMHFHLEWSGPASGCVHGAYYTGDDRYRSVGQQQDRRGHRQENRTVQNPKLDHPVSLKAPAASGQQHKQWIHKLGSSTDGLGGSQG
jgi:hypothetical protein